MNKMKVAVAIASFASISMAAPVWTATDGLGNVGVTGVGGYWFSYDDSKEAATPNLGPGASTTDFPAGSETEDVIGPWALEKGGIVVNYTIGGSTYLYPFAGIGFNWVVNDPTTLADVVAPQTWTTFCVTYTLTGTVPMVIEMKNDPALDLYDALITPLPPQATMKETCFPAAKFAQEGWSKNIVTVAASMAASQGMKFKAQLKVATTPPETCLLTIQSISTDGTGGPVAVVGSSAQSMKLSQMGRNLSISGLGKSAATVSLISLQGQVVASQVLTSGKVMSLSNLSSGVYLVRAQGEKLNLSKRITLR